MYSNIIFYEGRFVLSHFQADWHLGGSTRGGLGRSGCILHGFYFHLTVDYTESAEAFNFAQQAGAFEVHTLNGSQKVLVQVVPRPPVDTCRPQKMPKPVAIIGNFAW